MKRWPVWVVLALAVYHLLLTTSLVVNYGLRHPFLDQFRLYERYLSLGMWEGVLALENGHRPVLPGLVRWLDLFWLDGQGLLLTLTAWTAAALALALLLREVWRELDAPLAAAASVALAVTLLWGAHARMFIHAYEAQHLWYILLAVVMGSSAVIGAGSSTWRWGLGVVCCVAATFSFGPGLASFAALFALAVLQRAGWRVAGGVVLSALGCAVVYLWLLPGANGVRGQSQGLDLPWAVHYVVARWGAWWLEFLPPTSSLGWAERRWLAFALGLMGVGAVVVSAVRQWWRRERMGPLALHGLALVVFAATANALIAANRVGYFHEHPGQLFAERYLFWTALLWAGVALYGLARLSVVGPVRAQAPVLAVTLLIGLLAVQPALRWRAWSAEVYRRVEVSALANLMDVRAHEVFAEITDGPVDNAWRCSRLMRAQGVDVFAFGAMPVSLVLPSYAALPALPVTWREVVSPGGSVWSVQSLLPPELAQEAGERHWLVDASGRVVGAAGFTFHAASAAKPWRLQRPVMNGLQGFVRTDVPEALWLVAEREGQNHVLARLTGDIKVSTKQRPHS